MENKQEPNIQKKKSANKMALLPIGVFLVLYLGDLWHSVFPTDFPLVGDFPGNLAKNLDGGCCRGAK